MSIVKVAEESVKIVQYEHSYYVKEKNVTFME